MCVCININTAKSRLDLLQSTTIIYFKEVSIPFNLPWLNSSIYFSTCILYYNLYILVCTRMYLFLYVHIHSSFFLITNEITCKTRLICKSTRHPLVLLPFGIHFLASFGSISSSVRLTCSYQTIFILYYCSLFTSRLIFSLLQSGLHG